jgi:hypothetical protein
MGQRKSDMLLAVDDHDRIETQISYADVVFEARRRRRVTCQRTGEPGRRSDDTALGLGLHLGCWTNTERRLWMTMGCSWLAAK